MSNISSWDTTNLIYAILPNALKNGSNPAAFNSGYFPVYHGEDSLSNDSSILTNMGTGYGYTTDGTIKTDGANDYLNCGNNFNIGLNDFTVEMWFKSTTPTLYGRIFCVVDAVGWASSIDLYQAGVDGLLNESYTLRIYKDGSINATAPFYTLPFFDGNFHHFVLRADRDGNCDAYRDGTHIVSYTTNISPAATYDFNNNLQGMWIGQLSDESVGSYPTAFELAHFAIYKTVLSPSRILDNYALGQSLGGIQGFITNPGVDQVFDSLGPIPTTNNIFKVLTSSPPGNNRKFLYVDNKKLRSVNYIGI
jgi:hypothetical protein